MVRPIVYRRAKEIAIAVGIGEAEVGRYVEEEGLPAWQRKPKGNWFALPEDLEEWVRDQRDKYLKPPVKP